MRNLFPIFLFIMALYIYSCANQGSPSGGPKDTIPPTLLESNPANQTTNFSGKEFHFVFDERVDASKIKQNLIITPIVENNYKFRVKKNQLFLEFDEEFEDSTTFTFNFANGVTDVTEKNPVENFILAFSTGDHLDSISITGQVKNLYTNENVDKATIALYHINDSLNILTGKPRYFAKTDTSGTYQINNIKNGYYRIYAFEDTNNNLTCQPDEETHGFLADSINLNQNQTDINLSVQLLNIKPLSMVRAKKTGQYFDALYTKYLSSYELKMIDSTRKAYIPTSNLIKGRTTLRFYYDSIFHYDTDSLALLITATDSVYNISQDTIQLQYSESSRKPETMNSSATPKDKTPVDEKFSMKFQFNKPITSYSLDSMSYQYDTLFQYTLVDSVITWNQNRTEMTVQNELDKTWFKLQVDSLLNTLIDTSLQAKDSVEVDSLTNIKVSYLRQIKTDQVYFNFRKGSFVSIDHDTIDQVTRMFMFKNSENFGVVSGSINTSRENYTLQLVDKSYKLIQEIKNPTNFVFRNVFPGKYSFRILIDTNNDGSWTHGNLTLGLEPEEVYFYPESFDIRANWEIENINISF